MLFFFVIETELVPVYYNKNKQHARTYLLKKTNQQRKKLAIHTCKSWKSSFYLTENREQTTVTALNDFPFPSPAFCLHYFVRVLASLLLNLSVGKYNVIST